MNKRETADTKERRVDRREGGKGRGERDEEGGKESLSKSRVVMLANPKYRGEGEGWKEMGMVMRASRKEHLSRRGKIN